MMLPLISRNQIKTEAWFDCHLIKFTNCFQQYSPDVLWIFQFVFKNVHHKRSNIKTQDGKSRSAKSRLNILAVDWTHEVKWFCSHLRCPAKRCSSYYRALNENYDASCAFAVCLALTCINSYSFGFFHLLCHDPIKGRIKHQVSTTQTQNESIIFN